MNNYYINVTKNHTNYYCFVSYRYKKSRLHRQLFAKKKTQMKELNLQNR